MVRLLCAAGLPACSGCKAHRAHLLTPKPPKGAKGRSGGGNREEIMENGKEEYAMVALYIYLRLRVVKGRQRCCLT